MAGVTGGLPPLRGRRTAVLVVLGLVLASAKPQPEQHLNPLAHSIEDIIESASRTFQDDTSQSSVVSTAEGTAGAHKSASSELGALQSETAQVIARLLSSNDPNDLAAAAALSHKISAALDTLETSISHTAASLPHARASGTLNVKQSTDASFLETSGGDFPVGDDTFSGTVFDASAPAANDELAEKRLPSANAADMRFAQSQSGFVPPAPAYVPYGAFPFAPSQANRFPPAQMPFGAGFPYAPYAAPFAPGMPPQAGYQLYNPLQAAYHPYTMMQEADAARKLSLAASFAQPPPVDALSAEYTHGFPVDDDSLHNIHVIRKAYAQVNNGEVPDAGFTLGLKLGRLLAERNVVERQGRDAVQMEHTAANVQSAVHKAIAEAIPAAVAATVAAVRHAQAQSAARQRKETAFLHPITTGSETLPQFTEEGHMLPPLNVAVTGPPGFGPVPELPAPLARLPSHIRTIAAALPVPAVRHDDSDRASSEVDDVSVEEEQEPSTRDGEESRFASSRLLPIVDEDVPRDAQQRRPAYLQRVDTTAMHGNRLAPGVNLSNDPKEPLRSGERIVVSQPFDGELSSSAALNGAVDAQKGIPAAPVAAAKGAKYALPAERMISNTRLKTFHQTPPAPAFIEEAPAAAVPPENTQSQSQEADGSALRGRVRILQASLFAAEEDNAPSFFTPVWKAANQKAQAVQAWTETQLHVTAMMNTAKHGVSTATNAVAGLLSAFASKFHRQAPASSNDTTSAVSGSPLVSSSPAASMPPPSSSPTVSASPSAAEVIPAAAVQLANVEAAQQTIEKAAAEVQKHKDIVDDASKRVEAAVNATIAGEKSAETSAATETSIAPSATQAEAESPTAPQAEAPAAETTVASVAQAEEPVVASEESPAAVPPPTENTAAVALAAGTTAPQTDVTTPSESVPPAEAPASVGDAQAPAPAPAADTAAVTTPESASPASAPAAQTALRFRLRRQPAPEAPSTAVTTATDAVSTPADASPVVNETPAAQPSAPTTDTSQQETAAVADTPAPAGETHATADASTVVSDSSASAAPDAAAGTTTATVETQPTNPAAVITAPSAAATDVASSTPSSSTQQEGVAASSTQQEGVAASAATSNTAATAPGVATPPSSAETLTKVDFDFPNRITSRTTQTTEQVLLPALEAVQSRSREVVNAGSAADELSKEVMQQDEGLVRARSAAAQLEAATSTAGSRLALDTHTITGGNALNLPTLSLPDIDLDPLNKLHDQPDGLATVQAAHSKVNEVLQQAQQLAQAADLTHPVTMTTSDPVVSKHNDNSQQVLSPAGANDAAVLLELQRNDGNGRLGYSVSTPPHVTDIALAGSGLHPDAKDPLLNDDIALAKLAPALQLRFADMSAADAIAAGAGLSSHHMASSFALAHVAALAGDTADITADADALTLGDATAGQSDLLRAVDTSLQLESLSGSSQQSAAGLNLAMGDGKSVARLYDAVWALAALGPSGVQSSLMHADDVPLREIATAPTNAQDPMRFSTSKLSTSAMQLLQRGGLGIDAWQSLRDFVREHPASQTASRMRFRDQALSEAAATTARKRFIGNLLGSVTAQSGGESDNKYAASPMPSDKPKVLPETLPEVDKLPPPVHLGEPTEEYINMRDRSWWPGALNQAAVPEAPDTYDFNDQPLGTSRIGAEAVTAPQPLRAHISRRQRGKRTNLRQQASQEDPQPIAANEQQRQEHHQQQQQQRFASVHTAATGKTPKRGEYVDADVFLEKSSNRWNLFNMFKKGDGEAASKQAAIPPPPAKLTAGSGPGLAGRPQPPPDVPPLDSDSRVAVAEHPLPDVHALSDHVDPEIRHSMEQLFSDPSARIAAFPPADERKIPSLEEQMRALDVSIAAGEAEGDGAAAIAAAAAALPPRPVTPFAVPAKIGMRDAADVALMPESNEAPAEGDAERAADRRPDMQEAFTGLQRTPVTPADDADLLPHVEHGDPFGP